MSILLNTWGKMLGDMRRQWRPLLLTHLIFTALGVAIFTPLIGISGRLLLKLSGQPAVADQDIAYFLLSPLGMTAMIVFVALLIAILAFEQAVMMHIAYAAILDKQQNPRQAILHTAGQAHRIWLFTARMVIRILIIVLPVLGLCLLIAKYLISDFDINFYLTEKPSEFLIAVALIGTLLIAMAIVLIRKLIHWSLALPLVLFGGTAPRHSFAESSQLVSRQAKAIFGILLSWAALSLLLSFTALAILRIIGQSLIPTTEGTLSLTVIMLGAVAALWAISNFLITTFSAGSFANLIIRRYHEQAQSPAEAIFKAAADVSQASTFKLTTKAIVSTVVAVALIAAAAGAWLINGIPTVNSVSVIAHRGAAGKAPENTLAALQQAIDDQTDWLEIDVQESADGEVVIIHDSDFMKLAGNPIKVWDATRAQMDEIDIGSWFDASFSDQRAPSLKQVLELARDKAKVVIELKFYGHNEQLEQRVIDIVEQANMVEQTAIMSLKYDMTQKMKTLRPGWTVGLLSATAIGDLSQLDVDFLAVATGMASPGFIKRAHKAGKKVFVWTVDDRVSMSQMISLGVDGLITNEPEMARGVLAERADMTTLERLLIHAAQLFGEPYIPKQYRDNSP